jgi:hypothetical protein
MLVIFVLDSHWQDGRVVLAVLWRLWRRLYSFTYEIQTSQTDWP